MAAPETELLKITPSIEFNLAGGLLWTLREGDLLHLLYLLKLAGFDSISAIPARALVKDTPNEADGESSSMEILKPAKGRVLKVGHIEEAWNPNTVENFWKAIAAGLLGIILRQIDETYQRPPLELPLVRDALFPGKENCRQIVQQLLAAFPQAELVLYRTDIPDELKARTVLGITGKMGLTAEQIVEHAQQHDLRLAFDPTHLILPPDSLWNNLTDVPYAEKVRLLEQQFRLFAEAKMGDGTGLLKIVDINATASPTVSADQKIKDLLQGKGLLHNLIVEAKKAGIETLRIELQIPIWQQVPAVHANWALPFLQNIVQAVKEA